MRSCRFNNHMLVFLLTLVLLMFLSFSSQKSADAACCSPDYSTIKYGPWIGQPGGMACPNNPEYTCDIWYRSVGADLICLGVFCLGENIFGCRPTENDNPVIQFAFGCGSENIVTSYWVEYQANSCSVADCFFTCNTLAKKSLKDEECPEYEV